LLVGESCDVMGCRRGRETEALQANMFAAKLVRASLYETTGHTWRMRFHDLRATFETWARRAGWDQRDIDARTGHGSPEMAARYDRGARSLAELREEPFPNLAAAMPEVRAVLENRARLHTRLHRTELDTGDVQGGILGSNVAKRLGCEGGDLSPRTERSSGRAARGPSFKRTRPGGPSECEGGDLNPYGFTR
jgi:hypothetical protein